MRVTNKMMTNNFLRNVNTNQNILRTLDNQLTTGKKFHRPSDNPFAVARSMQLHDQINANKQYNENIKDTANWLDTTDTALKQASDVFQKINELLISAGNAGYSEKERLAIKDEINERINEFGQILNTSFDGKYIFGGYNGTEKPVKVTDPYKNPTVVKVDKNDIDKWKDNTIKLNVDFEGNGTTEEISIKIDKDKKINDIHELSKEIEKNVEASYKKKANELIENIKADGTLSDAEKEEKIKNINEKMEEFNSSFKVISNVSDSSIAFISKNQSISISSEKPISTDGKNELPTEITKTEVNENNGSNLEYTTDDEAKLEAMGGKLKTEISQGVIVEYSVSAKDIMSFKEKDGETKELSQVFNSILNHLDGKDENGNELDDDAVNKLLTEDLQNIKDAMENILTVRSKVGAMQNRMESAEEKNTDNNFNLTEILSKTEDIDFTEVTMQFAVAQTVYMASLQASAKILQPSLMDYLR